MHADLCRNTLAQTGADMAAINAILVKLHTYRLKRHAKLPTSLSMADVASVVASPQ